ncbi:uncharacterized protein LOC119949511 [Tachyglossus aculeatus]|uniref:uncharacterized protein LOC119949511 n=1 Tax=Tachyglossus aculeatus TaxID=9261 RepID=UPI0018F70DE6|nr:uncharacterized protein LOC119949511 [Tachyglossus aculeatus]XP_038627281.1 uncharacterized protein LOC119949511 [Tachyglossus aculeatus]
MTEPGPSEPPGLQTPGACFTKEEAPSPLSPRRLQPQSLPAGPARPPPTSALRRKRKFTPEEKKDEGYWDRRKKNNEAAKRSREKRRVNDLVLEQRVMTLLEENAQLRAELLALKFRFGLLGEDPPPPCCPELAIFSEDSGFSAPGSPELAESFAEMGSARSEARSLLPHKLRFKAASEPEEPGAEGSDRLVGRAGGVPLLAWHGPPCSPMPTSANSSLHTQLASLSAEVAQLKRLFSEQILAKMI